MPVPAPAQSGIDANTAEVLRQQGNDCYKAGKLQQAAQKYREAAQLAPEDATPLSNLSAVFYEMGLYTKSINSVESALRRPSVDGLRSKLRPRLIRSLLQAQRYDQADKALRDPSGLVDDAILLSTVSQSKSMSQISKHQAISKIIMQLPRYMPTLISGSEYYTIGQDDAEAQVNQKMMAESSEPLSFFFGGVGDARHLFATIITLRALERDNQLLAPRQYHFTINDLKAGALARDLVILSLLIDLAEAPDKDTEKLEIQTVLFLVYIAAVMPVFAYERLQSSIRRVIAALESRNDLPVQVHVSTNHTSALLKCLISWQGEVDMLCDTSTAIRWVVGFNNHGRGEGTKDSFEKTLIDSRCRLEAESFLQTGAHWLPSKLTKRFEPELETVLANGVQGKPNPRAKEYIARHWKVNPTMLDFDWHRDCHATLDGIFCYDPYRTIEHFHLGSQAPANATRLCEFFYPFFEKAALAILELRGRVTIECLHGDMTILMDQIRYGLLERKKDSPKLYDTVHMTNIPDYIGGPLATALYAVPLTKLTSSSAATSTCLRNMASWTSIGSFHNEYLIIHDSLTLQKLTGMEVLDQDLEYRMDPKTFLPHNIMANRSMPMANYFHWQDTRKHRLPFAALFPRASLMKWLWALLLKTILPVNRSEYHLFNLILSPMNTTIIFRILIHLQNLGYPSHWLSDFLAQSLSNNVVTSARPPKTCPLDIAESTCDNPMMRLSIAPFVSELTSLSLIFQPFLPFTIVTSSLPPPSAVFEYHLSAPDNAGGLPLPSNERQVWILVFHDATLWREVYDDKSFQSCDLRRLLDSSSESKLPKPEAKRAETFREKGVLVVSTFEYEAKTKRAKLWMVEEKMYAMVESGRWKVGLWSTETWRSCDSVPLTNEGARGLTKGKKWFDW